MRQIWQLTNEEGAKQNVTTLVEKLKILIFFKNDLCV